MDYNKIKAQGLKEAACGYAEKIGRKNGIRIIQAPSLDFGIRQLVFDLVNSNVVDFEKLYEFLDKNRYRENTPEDWWLSDIKF